MHLSHHILGAGLAVVAFVSAAEIAAADQPDRIKQRAVMEKVVSYAAERVDRERVGSGLGPDLVRAALKAADAQPMTPITHRLWENKKKAVPLSTYDWGQRLVRLGKGTKPLIPHRGCIVQFEGCRFASDDCDFDHHTAIVESVEGTMVTLLHQNVDGSLGNSKVRRQTVDFAGHEHGHYFVYLPVPK